MKLIVQKESRCRLESGAHTAPVLSHPAGHCWPGWPQVIEEKLKFSRVVSSGYLAGSKRDTKIIKLYLCDMANDLQVCERTSFTSQVSDI